MFIGISAKAHSGKDTAARFLQQYLALRGADFRIVPMAEPIKRICKIAFGFNDAQSDGDRKEEIDLRWGFAPRKAFQLVGTELFRDKIAKDIWVRCPHGPFAYLENIIIPAVRFLEEAAEIKRRRGVIIKLVGRNEPIKGGVENHESEALFDRIPHDVLIENSGTLEEFYDKLLSVGHAIVKRRPSGI